MTPMNIQNESDTAQVIYEGDLESSFETPTLPGTYMVPAMDGTLKEMLVLPYVNKRLDNEQPNAHVYGAQYLNVDSGISFAKSFVVQLDEPVGLFAQDIKVPPSRMVSSNPFVALEAKKKDGTLDLLRLDGDGDIPAAYRYRSSTELGDSKRYDVSYLVDGEGNVLSTFNGYGVTRYVRSPFMAQPMEARNTLILPVDKTYYLVGLNPANRVGGRGLVGSPNEALAGLYAQGTPVSVEVTPLSNKAEAKIGKTKIAGSVAEVIETLVNDLGIPVDDVLRLSAGAKGTLVKFAGLTTVYEQAADAEDILPAKKTGWEGIEQDVKEKSASSNDNVISIEKAAGKRVAVPTAEELARQQQIQRYAKRYRALLVRNDVDPEDLDAVTTFYSRNKSAATQEEMMGVDPSQSGLSIPQMTDTSYSPYGTQEESLPPQEIGWNEQRPEYRPSPLYAEDALGAGAPLSKDYKRAKPLGDLSFMRSLMREANLDDQLASSVKTLTKAMHSCGELLFTFYQQQDDYLERYGEDEVKDLEDLLRDMFKQNGKLVLFLKQKSIAASNAGETIDIAD